MNGGKEDSCLGPNDPPPITPVIGNILIASTHHVTVHNRLNPVDTDTTPPIYTIITKISHGHNYEHPTLYNIKLN